MLDYELQLYILVEKLDSKSLTEAQIGKMKELLKLDREGNELTIELVKQKSAAAASIYSAVKKLIE